MKRNDDYLRALAFLQAVEDFRGRHVERLLIPILEGLTLPLCHYGM